MRFRTLASCLTAAVLAATVLTGLVAGGPPVVPAAAAETRSSPTLRQSYGNLPANATAAEITDALAATGATRIRVHEASESRTALQRGLPTDTFKVWTSWADYYKNGKLHIAFYGRWQFKSGFIGSGDPDDASGMAVTGFPSRCWTKVGAGVRTHNELGERTYLSYRKSDGHASSIWGVNDKTRAFQLENKYGFHWIDMRRDRIRKACRARKAGSYYMEHNQEGSGGWSASISLAVFSLSYSGSGGQVLQKAAKYDYYAS